MDNVNRELDHPADRRERPGSIVIVDDEEVVLSTLSSFLALETDYDVHTFTAAGQALDALKDFHVDLVISDFLMPKMNGLEFLAEVKRRYPDAVRVLLTGYADRENAIRAINEVGLFQYIEKPWDNEQLILVIKNGLNQRRLERTLSDKAIELDRTLLEKERLAQEQELFREELALARRIQESLLPQSFPEAAGFLFSASYLPALQVGGDFYDVIPLTGGSIAAIVADVTGHGIQAALSTTMLKAVFTEFAHQSVGPVDILGRMNDVLHRVLPSDVFVAASVASVDPREGVVNIVSGGGPFPFHIRRSNADAQPVISNGLLLGVVDEDLYRHGDEVSVVLEPGDGLLLYTDGLSELENTDGDQYGETRMRRSLSESVRLPGPELCSLLLEDARAYATDNQQWDDITILTIDRSKDD
jgi:sigma-B regulation protein RsbU (phosphoserine phosphatase)